MDLGIKGKKALVTGGTRGIGQAITRTLADEGCDIATCSRNGEELEAALSDLRSRGVNATGQVLDVTDRTGVSAFVDASADTLGGLDIIVSNVGAMAMGTSPEDWMRNLEMDVFSLLSLVDSGLPLLRKAAAEKGEAAIVSIGSTAAVATMNASSYGAVKATLVHYIKGLAKDCASQLVRANVVSPGMIYFEGGIWDRVKNNKPEIFARQLARNPLGRMGDPQEIANAVTFLCSPRASFITGSNLVVDGGMTDRVNY